MSRSIEAAIEAARARAVPWDAERSARIERSIGARRVLAAPLARWALGGLASVVLCASVSRIAQVSGERGVSDQRFEEPAPLLPVQPVGEPAEEESLERPVGDGGFD